MGKHFSINDSRFVNALAKTCAVIAKCENIDDAMLVVKTFDACFTERDDEQLKWAFVYLLVTHETRTIPDTYALLSDFVRCFGRE